MTRLALADKPIAFIDTETTGLDPELQEVIEVAIILQWPNGQVQEWCSKIKPTRLENADPKALEINGYAADPKAWDNAPTFEQAAEEMTFRLRDAVICGHNVAFDVSFLESGMKRAGKKFYFPYHRIDTVALAYAHLVPQGLERLRLDDIRAFLGWSTDNAHTALVDARDCQRIYNHLATPRAS
jgi:DNA polymerase III subunit epsilon